MRCIHINLWEGELMAQRTYEFTVRISGNSTKIAVSAVSGFAAKELVEAQYGKGCVVGTWREI